MSKGWYVKVDVPVQFMMDCNIGVVAESEGGAQQAAEEIVANELRKAVDELQEGFPWDFTTGCLNWSRGGGTLAPVFELMRAGSATPDPDFDPDEPDAGDLMDAAMCLLEAFWNLPDDDIRRSDFLPNHGIAHVRSQVADAARLCHQTWMVVIDDDGFDCFDWDFCPQFLDRCMDEQMAVKSNDLHELVRMWKEAR